MADGLLQPPVPTADLAAYFRVNGIAFRQLPRLDLGFGRDRPQYRFWEYALPGPGHTMGIFFEWHTEDFFDWPENPHLAVGIRGPLEADPHRGRGLAIGMLASHAVDPADPTRLVPLFEGCPPPPGGPSCFIEDFSINEGTAPIPSWQLSFGKPVPELGNRGTYRIDIHVSAGMVWAGIWQVLESSVYHPIGQASCCDGGPGSQAGSARPCPELPEDVGVGNAFIGTGFASPDTRSYADAIHLAHWPENG